MSRHRLLIWAAAAAFAGGLGLAVPARAVEGHSDAGDSYENDMQRNPRLIEPYADQTRYRAYYPRQGFYERQRWYRPDPRVPYPAY